MMAWQLSQEEREQVRDIFFELDVGKLGYVSFQAFHAKVKQDFPSIESEEIDAWFRGIDIDNDSRIYYSDLLG